MKKQYAVALTFYRKAGNTYENGIQLTFAWAASEKEAFKFALSSDMVSKSISDGFTIGMHVECQIPKQISNEQASM